MPWTTANGHQLDFPTAIWSKIVRAGARPKHADIMEALRETERIHNEAVTLSSRVTELEAQVLRLTHENEFMLRLLNDRDSA